MSCYQYLLRSTYSYVTTLRTNEKFIAHLLGTLGALLPTCLGDKVLTLGVSPILQPFQHDRFASNGFILFGLFMGGYFAVSVKTAGVATPVAVAVMVMVPGDGGSV
jgi:hypothetical protein